MPNRPDAPNAAIALWFHFGRHWRRVGDPGVVRSDQTSSAAGPGG